MLDDCKGERLEEVLAVFSSAVLKKLVAAAADAEGEHPAIAQQLALEERGYAGDKADLLALNLAHRASLSRFLRDKDAARRKYQDLAELLDVKERNIARRQEQVRLQTQAGDHRHVTEDMRLDMRRHVRNNWAGNEQWMETLLCGDTNARQDGVLSAPFDRVWRRVQSDRLSELEDEGKGLLEKLDSRVRAQRESLQKWQDFREEVLGKQAAALPPERAQGKDTKRGIDFGFDNHARLHRRQMSPGKSLRANTHGLETPCASLLQDLQKELKEVEAVRMPSLSSIIGPRIRQPTRPPPQAAESADETVSELSDLDDPTYAPDESLDKPLSQPLEAIESRPHAQHLPTENPTTITRKDSQTRSTMQARDSSRSRQARSSVSLSRPSSQSTQSSGNGVSRHGSQSSQRQIRPTVKLEPQRSPSPEPVSPTTAMADKILASMDNASPSPVKQSKPRHTLSLAERTRLSMARMSRGGNKYASPEEEDDEHTTETSPTRDVASSEQSTPALEDQDLAYEDLVSRTRKSLAGFEASRQKAQLERRRSQRRSRMAPRGEGSYFPKVEEEAPGTPEEPAPAQELDVEDMEAIFKSRPRLQTSPGPSPTRRWDADDDM